MKTKKLKKKFIKWNRNFRKEYFRELRSLSIRIRDLELKVWALENKPKYKIGSHLEYGDKKYIVREIKPRRRCRTTEQFNESTTPSINIEWKQVVDYYYGYLIEDIETGDTSIIESFNI